MGSTNIGKKVQRKKYRKQENTNINLTVSQVITQETQDYKS